MKRIAEDCSASYNVAQLSSLFTVCAAALNGAEDYGEDYRDCIHMDVKHVLEWGAVLAGQICEEVERLEGAAEKSKRKEQA